MHIHKNVKFPTKGKQILPVNIEECLHRVVLNRFAQKSSFIQFGCQH